MDETKKGKTIKSAFDSETFDKDVLIHVDRKVGSATISPCGRDVALASTDGLDIIDLDSPLNPPRHLRHGLPWLVADVQWSPFAARDYWVVSTANQKALVWNLNMNEESAQGIIEHTLHGHTRAITDINFSAHHPDILTTCAVDGYVHCWDLRRPRQPVLTFVDWFAGATQVKFNRQDSHILASSHDRWLRIWDDRKGAAPLRSINAHESKIYGVDWNRTRSTGVVTCSLDKSIKFWDYGNEVDEPERIIRTDFPVWRARHTPFGWGVLAMPQDTPGNLHLFERRLKDSDQHDSFTPPVATFPGHDNHKVKEFLWRSRGGISDDGADNREFQLVSWGEDNQLRLQHVDQETLQGVGYVKGSQLRRKLNVTRKGAVYKTFRTIDTPPSDRKIPTTITGPRPSSSGLKVSALSAGMKKIGQPHAAKTHMMIRAPAMKGKDKLSKQDDQNQKQIDWMSGIKFTKQESRPPPFKRMNSRRLSLLSPDFEQDFEWDSPENLPDEIVRIHEQLPKITFEDVNMDKRIIIASMNGPWGENGSSIYIKVTISFPEQYPESKSPSFMLGKTSLMADEVYTKLKKEVQQIAAGFVSRRQGCLEATLCYLLGEVDLETSTTFFNDVDDLDDMDPLADESSSDDEDGEIPAGPAMMSQELDTSATENLLAPVNRNANVPRARLCGARFSPSGKLACFFPPKEDKMKSLFETHAGKPSTRSKVQSLFESFGRLTNTSPVPRGKTISLVSGSRNDSDSSDDSDASSESDSDSSQYHMERFPMSEYFRRTTQPYRRGSPTVLSQRSSAAGTGTGIGSGTGVGGKGKASRPKNILVLHDISNLIPSKMELASDYAIFGDGPEVCETNATAADKHGHKDLADVWRYAAMLLHNEVPLEVLDQTHRREPILVIARDASKRSRSDSGSDSGVDFSYDSHYRPKDLSGRVKWGTSPLAKQLIADLFAYFEAQADVQMLAMLSCVFSEPAAKDAVSIAEHHMSQPQTPLSMKTPAFSLDYFPTDAAAWSMYHRTPIHSTASTPKFGQSTPGLYGSVGSSNGAWNSDPASASYSCGETPPLRSNRASSEHLNLHTQSLSTSPDNPRSFRRANSGIASSFAASLSRPFTITSSSSPPNPPPTRKRPSPVENMLSSLAPSTITWGNTTVLGSVKEQNSTGRSSLSDDEGSRDDWKPSICTGISLVIENQNAFDDDGCMKTSLLDTSHTALYSSYRSAYAELLYAWSHPLERLEILKFNGLKDCFPTEPEIPDTKSFAASIRSSDSRTSNHEHSPPSPIILGKKDPFSMPAGGNQGLDIAGFCLKHDSRLDPLTSGTYGGATGRCERCKQNQRELRCTICMEPISVHFVPCLSCGCATHEQCLMDYHSRVDAEYLSSNTACPGGCDCDCGVKASVGVVESWEVLVGAIEQLRLLDAKHGGKTKDKQAFEEWQLEDRPDWDEVNYFPSGGLGKGYSTLTRTLSQVRSREWSMSGLKQHRPSSLRREELP